MLYAFYPPSPQLSAFVASFWLRRYDPQPRSRGLPSGTAQLVIDLSGDGLCLPRPDPHLGLGPDPGSRSHEVCAAVLHGVDSTACVLENDHPVYEFGVNFQTGGLYPFFAPPTGELHNLHLSLDALWGAQVVRDLCERVAEADSLQARAQILEAVLVRQLIRPLAHHPAVTAVLRAFSAPSMPSGGRIAWVADEAGLSRGWLTRVFRDEVGLTPKQFARIHRFWGVLEHIHAGWTLQTEQTCQRMNWAQLALDCGYYDQAHLINEFRTFAGVSPSAYLRARSAHSPYTLLAE